MQPYKVTQAFLTKVCPREGFPSRKYFLTKASSRNVNPLHRNTRLAGFCHGMPLCLAPQSRNVCHGSLSSQISPHEGFSSRNLFMMKIPLTKFPLTKVSPQKLLSRMLFTGIYTFRVVWGPRARSRKLCLRVPMPRTVMIRHFRVLGGPGRGFSVKGYLPCPRPPDSLSFLFIL